MNVLEIQIRSIEMQFAFATCYVLIVNLNDPASRPNMCSTHTHIYIHAFWASIQAQAHNVQWFVQSGKCAALKRISINLLPKFEWIRLEWHCFINPVCVSNVLIFTIRSNWTLIHFCSLYLSRLFLQLQTDFPFRISSVSSHTHYHYKVEGSCCDWLILFIKSAKIEKLFAFSQNIHLIICNSLQTFKLCFLFSFAFFVCVQLQWG